MSINRSRTYVSNFRKSSSDDKKEAIKAIKCVGWQRQIEREKDMVDEN